MNTIKLDNNVLGYLNIDRIVRHGWVLSPLLVNLYTELIFRNIDHFSGLKICRNKISYLHYAVDTVHLEIRTLFKSFWMW